MKLTMLGTGNALVTKCYNTCFVLDDHGKPLMVDAGGGNTVLTQLEKSGYHWTQMRNMIITHKHIDHLLGMLWMVRLICQSMENNSYEGEADIYGHEEVISLLSDIAAKLLTAKQSRHLGERLHLNTVRDGEQRLINGRGVTFIDLKSTKARQFGFSLDLDNGGRLTCLGDEPCSSAVEAQVKDSTWLLSEAFCLHGEADKYRPHEKHHSTVKDACELAEKLGVKNLVLYHTEDDHIRERKALYSAEGRQYFSGNLFVPDDLESIEIN